jgi:hypothetical protein
MKSLLSLLFIAISFCVFSQKPDVTIDKEIDYGVTELYYSGIAKDAIGISGDSTWTYTIKKKCVSQIKPVIGIKLNRVAVGGTVSVVFAQKVLGTQSYSTITTVSWKKSSADTVIYFTPSAATAAVYNRISLTGSSSTIKASVSYIDFKVFE